MNHTLLDQLYDMMSLHGHRPFLNNNAPRTRGPTQTRGIRLKYRGSAWSRRVDITIIRGGWSRRIRGSSRDGTHGTRGHSLIGLTRRFGSNSGRNLIIGRANNRAALCPSSIRTSHSTQVASSFSPNLPTPRTLGTNLPLQKNKQIAQRSTGRQRGREPRSKERGWGKVRVHVRIEVFRRKAARATAYRKIDT